MSFFDKVKDKIKGHFQLSGGGAVVASFVFGVASFVVGSAINLFAPGLGTLVEVCSIAGSASVGIAAVSAAYAVGKKIKNTFSSLRKTKESDAQDPKDKADVEKQGKVEKGADSKEQKLPPAFKKKDDQAMEEEGKESKADDDLKILDNNFDSELYPNDSRKKSSQPDLRNSKTTDSAGMGNFNSGEPDGFKSGAFPKTDPEFFDSTKGADTDFLRQSGDLPNLQNKDGAIGDLLSKFNNRSNAGDGRVR